MGSVAGMPVEHLLQTDSFAGARILGGPSTVLKGVRQGCSGPSNPKRRTWMFTSVQSLEPITLDSHLAKD